MYEYLLHNKELSKKPRKYKTIVESLSEFWGWVDHNKIKLKRNLLKATYLTIIENGSYTLLFTQDIGRRYRPSVKEWVDERKDVFIAKIENVSLSEIDIKYNWIMGR